MNVPDIPLALFNIVPEAPHTMHFPTRGFRRVTVRVVYLLEVRIIITMIG